MLTLNTGDITYNDIAYIINKCNITHGFYLLALSIVYLTNKVTLANSILRKNLYLNKIL
jgi:hypothetical protein